MATIVVERVPSTATADESLWFENVFYRTMMFVAGVLLGVVMTAYLQHWQFTQAWNAAYFRMEYCDGAYPCAYAGDYFPTSYPLFYVRIPLLPMSVYPDASSPDPLFELHNFERNGKMASGEQLIP